MTRQHGGAIRAVRHPDDGEDGVRFDVISAKRGTIRGEFAGDRRDLFTLDATNIGILIDNAGDMVIDDAGDAARQLRPDQAAVLFQPYNPFVAGLAAANHDGHLLEELGARLAYAPDNFSQPDSALPAAYTYLGQFIAHDVSRMVICQNDDEFNFRTPRLDLDSLFGTIDAKDKNPAASVEFRGGLGLGLTAGAPCNRKDLPRSASGEPQIADARNDANLAVAQFTVMMTHFYWKMLACHGHAADAQRATKQHFQHVVLYDYLRQIIDPAVYEDVVHMGGPKIIARAPFFMPLEFALAAFRVGHSMVRGRYEDFSDNPVATVSDLMRHTHRGGYLESGADTDKERRLNNSWPVRWDSLVDLSPAERPNLAMAIDERMGDGLQAVPWWQFREIVNYDMSTYPSKYGDAAIPLPVQTLLRGRLAGLPDAQTLHAAINALLPASAQLPDMLTSEEIAKVTSDDLKSFLNRTDVDFTECTPLWFYCLRESALPPACGNRFGPLTSRIVMETIYTGIAEDPEGILSAEFKEKSFQPDGCLVNKHGIFGLREFVRHATA